MNVAIWVITCGQRSRSRPTIRSRGRGGRGEQQRRPARRGCPWPRCSSRRTARRRTAPGRATSTRSPCPANGSSTASSDERQLDRGAPGQPPRGRTRASAATTATSTRVRRRTPRTPRAASTTTATVNSTAAAIFTSGASRCTGECPVTYSACVCPAPTATRAPAAAAARARRPPAAAHEPEQRRRRRAKVTQHAEHAGQAGGQVRLSMPRMP